MRICRRQYAICADCPRTRESASLDQHDIELGSKWSDDIIDALQDCNALICVYSPAYFKSEYCGKEWQVFHSRCEAHAKKGNAWPKAIKPVLWISFMAADLPVALAAEQFKLGDPQAIHNTRGLKYLLKQYQQYQIPYNDFVEDLAAQIVEAGNAQTLPTITPAPELAATASAFARMAAAGPAPSPASGPNHVRFVYVAADPREFGDARSADAYLDFGGPHWRPFYPACSTHVHQFMQHLVSDEELNFTSDELPFGPNLIADIENAWKRREIVVFIVDGWSLQWKKQYRDVLHQFDQRLDCHWCVLVPWNESDADSVSKRKEILEAIDTTLYRHAQLMQNPIFYRANICSLDELRGVLREVLTRLKAEVRRNAVVERPVPHGVRKSVITGPAG